LADTSNELAPLVDATRHALLTAIKDAAPNANNTNLEKLAHAFALAVGAKPGKLPGTLPTSD